jgi:uncharacterized coiled-coil protein SlyX
MIEEVEKKVEKLEERVRVQEETIIDLKKKLDSVLCDTKEKREEHE